MTIDQVLQVYLVDGEEEPISLAGVVLTVSLFLNGRYRFSFRSKPSDSEGCVVVDYDYLEENRLRNLRIQPLDYKTTLDECDAFIRITLPPQKELISAAGVLERMGGAQYSEIADSWRTASNGILSSKGCEVSLSGSLNKCHLRCLIEKPLPPGAEGGRGSEDSTL